MLETSYNIDPTLSSPIESMLLDLIELIVGTNEGDKILKLGNTELVCLTGWLNLLRVPFSTATKLLSRNCTSYLQVCMVWGIPVPG